MTLHGGSVRLPSVSEYPVDASMCHVARVLELALEVVLWKDGFVVNVVLGRVQDNVCVGK